MRTAIAVAITVLCVSPAERPRLPVAPAPAPVAESFDLAATGIAWQQGLASVAGRGRPILLLHLVGNFNDVFC